MSDTHTCRICGITCPHVKAGGAWWCPNCAETSEIEEARRG